MREFESIGEMLAAEDGTVYISGNSLSDTACVNVKYNSFLTAGGLRRRNRISKAEAVHRGLSPFPKGI